MPVFLIVFLTLYSALHAYAFAHAKAALHFGPKTGWFIAGLMLILILTPMLVHILENAQLEFAARSFAQIGYLWMGFIFLFFWASLAFDLLRLLGFVSGWTLQRHASLFTIPRNISFFVSAISVLAICVHGYFSALNFRIERRVFETAKLPADIERLKIVQVSDIHLGLIIRSKRLDKILDIVRSENPDLLVSTGDLVDGQINHLLGLAERLQQIRPKYGKYAITGNHEYYAGIEHSLDFTRRAGFVILQDASVKDQVINIVGVSDPAGRQFGIKEGLSEKALLDSVNKGRFTLFLKHRPVVEPGSLGLFDLQLSGHTHHGQIYPFTWFTTMVFPMNAGTFHLDKNSLLHVNRGTGTWGPPIRFLVPPEVTVIELIRSADKGAQG